MGFYIGSLSKEVIPSNVLTAIGQNIPIYGIKFDGTNSVGIREYDAVDKTFTYSTTSRAGRDDFKDIPIFTPKECITQYNSSTGKREVLAYKGDSNWDTLVTNKTGDRCMEFSSFWYSRPSANEFLVSPSYVDGFLPSPMHYRKGVMHDKVYHTKYALNSSYVSQPGTSPLVNTTMQTSRTNLRSKGMYVSDYAVACSLQILMAIKYGTLDAQSVVGFGHSASGNSGPIGNGGGDGILGLDGTVSALGTNEAVVSMGIENWWGNIYHFCDGMIRYGGTNGQDIYINTDIEGISNWPTTATIGTTWTKTSIQSAATSYFGYYDTFVFDKTYPWLTYPATLKSVAGDWNTFYNTSSQTNTPPVTDGFWSTTDAASMYCALLGCYCHDALSCGPFSLSLSDAVSFSDTGIGAFGFFLA